MGARVRQKVRSVSRLRGLESCSSSCQDCMRVDALWFCILLLDVPLCGTLHCILSVSMVICVVVVEPAIIEEQQRP